MIAEKRLQRTKHNRIKKEAKKGGRANKVGHKLPECSSDRFCDKLLKTGRGYASGGISVGNNAPQETAKEHGCTAEPSPAPPETTGAVLFEAVEKTGRQARTERPTDIEPAS